jgi:hypothetical protein
VAPADLWAGARLLARLPRFLRRPTGVDDARRALGRRLETRAATFLELVRRTVYARAESPYARLLRHAGCAYADLERLVRTDGVERALGRLLAAGVYLTVAEFRGDHPVRRGALTIEVEPSQLRNPLVGCDLPMRTGGSRSLGTPVGWSLDFVRDRAVNLRLAEAARGPARRRYAVWAAPGSAAIAHLLDIYARSGAPHRWYSPVDPDSPELSAPYRWSPQLLRAATRCCGRRLPMPVHVPVLAPGPIVGWLGVVLGGGEVPHLHTRPSAVLRICEAAATQGIDVGGAEVAVGGEPITPARATTMRRAGLRILPRYAAVETGLIGDGCLAPRGSDDVHVFHDLVAVVQPAEGQARGVLPRDALLLSSLRPTAPLILLNVSMGDAGVLEPTSCACPLSTLGWTTQLRSIVSFEKLTGEGMTFHDTDVARILDEILPARFGGGPGDYQLAEGETPDGRSRLRLLVHPGVGPVDSGSVGETFLSALRAPGGAGEVMALVWRAAGLLEVERRAPETTPAGKVLHVHRAPGGRNGST